MIPNEILPPNAYVCFGSHSTLSLRDPPIVVPNTRKSPFSSRHPTLRWVDYARRSWQRLGHLRIICSLSHPSTGTSLEGLTEGFRRVITAPVGIPPHLRRNVEYYVRTYRTNKYPKTEVPISRVELQDIYLSDARLRSRSGAITGDMGTAGYRHAVYVEMPTWAVRLKLLRRYNYTLTDRGKVLLHLRPIPFHTAGRFDQIANPYILTGGERYFFAFCLLDVDGDLIRGIFSRLLARDGAFTRSEVGSVAADVLKDLLASRKSRSLGGAERQSRDRIAATIRSVANQKKGGLGPRESLATPRVEPLVDCGILERTHPSKYVYQFTPNGRGLANALVLAETLDVFIESELAQWFTESAGRATPEESKSSKLKQYIAKSYTLLRSGLGYCSIREVAMLAVASAIADDACEFDLLDTERTIADMAKEYGRDVRFTKSRQGDIAQLRIVPKLIDKIASLSDG